LSSADPRFERAFAAAEAGRWEDAAVVYRELAGEGNAVAAYNLAELLTRLEGREVEAEAACHAAVTAGDPDAWGLLALMLEDHDRNAEAEAAWRHAAEAGVEDARTGLGRVLIVQERYAEAEAVLRDAVAAGEEDAPALLAGLIADRN
jgi:hypothetical protein